MIGDHIRNARKQAGLTQEELGKSVGVSGVAIMRYEKNQREPGKEMLEKIAQALNVNPIDLTGWASYDEQHKDSIKEINDFGAFIFYLESINYKVNINPESAETFSALLTKNGVSTTYTDSEFKEFQKTIQESVDYQVWRKNNA